MDKNLPIDTSRATLPAQSGTTDTTTPAESNPADEVSGHVGDSAPASLPVLLPVTAKADLPVISLRETGDIHIDDEIASVVGNPYDLDPKDDKQIGGHGEGWNYHQTQLGNLRQSVKKQRAIRPIYVWKQTGAILDGVALFRICEELGLKPYVDYYVWEIDLADREAAKHWRFEWNVSTARHLPEGQRAFEFLTKFPHVIAEWQRKGRQNQSRAGKRMKVTEKINWVQQAALAANVSATTIKDTWAAIRAIQNLGKLDAGTTRRLHSNFLKMAKGRYPTGRLLAEIKGAKGRAPRPRRVAEGALSDDVYIPGSFNVVVNNECLATLKQMKPGDAKFFVFSPPYPYVKVDYGFSIPWAENEVLWTEMMRSMFTEMHRIIPDSGGIIVNVDNTRNPETQERCNCVFILYQIAKSLGMYDWGDTIWHKQNISGKKMGCGSDQVTCQRRNHEYVLAYFKGRPRKEAPTYFDSDKNRLSISTWDDCDAPGVAREQFWESFWSIPPSFDREGDHPAVFPASLAYNILQLWTSPGDVICDPFCGRGTTLAVSALLGRRWIGVEFDADWVKRAKSWAERMEKLAQSDTNMLTKELIKLARPLAACRIAKADHTQQARFQPQL